MKNNVFLGEVFVDNTLKNINIKEEMSTNFQTRYLMRAFMAGVLVAFGYVMIIATDAAFNGSIDQVGKLLGYSMFSLTLAAIVFTKSELLTSNMMMISVAKYYNKISFTNIFKMLGLCYLGNFIGGLIIAILLAFTSLFTPEMLESIHHYIQIKQAYITDGQYIDLFIRAIFANFFINIAMLIIYSQNVKSDFGKIIMMFFGVFTFVYLGFEHSVANTELFLIAGMYQLINGFNLDFNALYASINIVIVIIGNFIGGGVLIGFYYAYLNDSRKLNK